MLLSAWSQKDRIFLEDKPQLAKFNEVRAGKRLLLGQKIDLNHAGFSELVALPGIGPSLAQRIMRDRERKGLYLTIQDLIRVKGIGPKKMQKIREIAIVTAHKNR